jgi:hypothetical protein
LLCLVLPFTHRKPGRPPTCARADALALCPTNAARASMRLRCRRAS